MVRGIDRFDIGPAEARALQNSDVRKPR